LLKFIQQLQKVTKNDFIFSEQRFYRVARHVAFWTAWWMIFAVFFHYPLHSFKGWNVSGSSSLTFQKLSLTAFILKTLIVNSFLAVIVPQIIFIYFLIYWVFPHYLNKKLNPLLLACLTPVIFFIYLIVATTFKHAVPYFNYLAGVSDTIPSFDFGLTIQPTLRDQLTTLPIVAGFAIMITIMKQWWLKQNRTEILYREKTKAELQILKSQIHPHFLFNTLNNLYYLTLTCSPDAPALIKKLSGMIHYILNECNQPLVPLEQEINMLRDYIDLEKIRYGEQIDIEINLPANGDGKRITPLLLIPFVENSFKHGASKVLRKSFLKVNISIENNILHFYIENNIPETPEHGVNRGNIGIRNVRKRLDILYPGLHDLQIIPGPGNFQVKLNIQLEENIVLENQHEETTSTYGSILA
jgi:sensor histidine kinase YesM